MRLLARYGVDTVFGIPGVHTLDFCHGLLDGPIHHVQARNEQGAGFMADGYARVSGRPGVALVISGPGVTNALTAVGQAWADSVPMLLLSSETDSASHGKGWGYLHEIPDQRAVTDPLTALSARASCPADVPELVAQAFAIFAGQRPRPVHLSIPIDVLAMPVTEEWEPRTMPSRAHPDAGRIEAAAALLRSAARPVLMVGGGAVDASAAIRTLVDQLGCPVLASTAGKGIVADDHPLSLSASGSRLEVQEWLGAADLVLAVGTELAETDSFVDELPLNGKLIRIDLDPRKINDQYPATIGIVADAAVSVAALLATGPFTAARDRAEIEAELAGVRQSIDANLTASQRRHERLLEALDAGLPADTILMGDICQLVYTGAFASVSRTPRSWHYPAGYCTLGCALPNAIGAKFALPDRPVVCLAGDGGFMFTVQELIVAVDEGLGIPVIIWDNEGLKQIQEGMLERSIPLVGVTGSNPDFIALAKALRCNAVMAESLEQVIEATRQGFDGDRPTVIVVREDADWLS